MRILHIITGTALMAAFVIGCSKTPNQPISTSSAAVQDLGVVSLSDATPQYLAIAPNKSYALTGAASSNGMTKIVMVVQETNADKTVRIHDPETFFMVTGHRLTIKSGDVSIRFTPEVTTK
jgi:hypothetical protein